MRVLRDSQRRAEIKELKDELEQLRESEGLSKLALAQIQKELDLLSLKAPKPSRQNTPTILVPKEVQEKDRQLKTMREELIEMDSTVLAAKAQAEQQQYEVDQLKAKLAAKKHHLALRQNIAICTGAAWITLQKNLPKQSLLQWMTGKMN